MHPSLKICTLIYANTFSKNHILWSYCQIVLYIPNVRRLRYRKREKKKQREFPPYQKAFVFIRKFFGFIKQLNLQINKTPLWRSDWRREMETSDLSDPNPRISFFHTLPLNAENDQYQLSDWGEASQSKILLLYGLVKGELVVIK